MSLQEPKQRVGPEALRSNDSEGRLRTPACRLERLGITRDSLTFADTKKLDNVDFGKQTN